jgi:phage terminase large subunit-like protein
MDKPMATNRGVQKISKAQSIVDSPQLAGRDFQGVSGFKRFCDGLTLENGEPFVLEPFQKRMLEDFFTGARESLILISKKNGKSTLLAALALHHLVTTDNAMCPIAAASREQAMWIFDQARGFVQRSPELQGLVRVLRGYREIRRRHPDDPENPKEMFGLIKVLAADEDTADGVIPTLALVDELHRHKKPELYAVFRDGLGPRDGQMITISTAGDDEESPLGQLRREAHALPGMTQDGAYRHVRTGDFALHEWALDPDEDREDMKVVKRANPASWQTIPELERRFRSPSMKPWQWARFACGVWMFGEKGAFSDREWRDCEDPKAKILAGSVGVVIGVDLGWRWDTTAIVPVWPDKDRLVVGKPTVIVPPHDGSSTPYEDIWAVVADLADEFSHPMFVIDPEAGGQQLAQQIENELDAEVIEHSQKNVPMANAAQKLSEAISSGVLRHPGDQDLTRHVLAAAPRPVGEGWRLVKPKRSSAVIDGAVALAMAVSITTMTGKSGSRWVPADIAYPDLVKA